MGPGLSSPRCPGVGAAPPALRAPLPLPERAAPLPLPVTLDGACCAASPKFPLPRCGEALAPTSRRGPSCRARPPPAGGRRGCPPRPLPAVRPGGLRCAPLHSRARRRRLPVRCARVARARQPLLPLRVALSVACAPVAPRSHGRTRAPRRDQRDSLPCAVGEQVVRRGRDK